MTALRLDERDGSVRFAVRAQPRVSRSEILNLRSALKVRLSAAPVDDAANVAFVGLLAAAFGASRRSVRVIAGATSRGKVVELDAVSVENIRRLARESR